MARRLLANCDGTDPATSLRPIVRVGVAMQILDIDISGHARATDDLTSRFLPADVIAACASIRITDVSHPDPLAKGIENPVSVSAVLESWNGAPRSDLTMRFKRFELAGDALALVDTSDEVGTWNTTVQPSTSPDETNFVLDLEVTLPTEDLELLITGGEFQQRVPIRDRLELLVRRPGEVVYSDSIDSIEPGEQIELGVRLAGPDLDAQTVEYSFVGRGGNLSAASGVTNPIGQSTFTFTAPTDGGQIVISAEEQHAGDTWVDTLSINVTDPLIVTVSPAQRPSARARPCSSSPRSTARRRPVTSSGTPPAVRSAPPGCTSRATRPVTTR